MITINADRLQDGLYNIKNGKIFKYKAKGGTVRTYDMGEIVLCKDCKWWQDSEVGVVECPICTRIHDMVFEMGAYDYCSKGKRREDGKA